VKGARDRDRPGAVAVVLRRIVPELMTIAVGRRTVDAEIYRPSGAGPWPGVLILHELFGLNDHVRADARDLAAHGYLTMAPDLYSGEGAARYCMRAFFRPQGLLNHADGEAVAEVHRLLDELKAMPDCNGRLGMIGMCLTGGFVLHMAKRDDLAAPVVYHHAFGLRGPGIHEGDLAAVRGPIQAHFADQDTVLCPKNRVDALARALGDRLQPTTHRGAGHGLRSRFRNTPAGRDAWQATLAFLSDQLAAPSAA
jgi:carboxymethylenebutenolidase